jgi:hypothetical protein
MDPEIVQINGIKYIKIGKWLFDPFLMDDDTDGSGTLGITVYEQGTDPINDNGRVRDIFVKPDLSVSAH